MSLSPGWHSTEVVSVLLTQQPWLGLYSQRSPECFVLDVAELYDALLRVKWTEA